MRPECRVEGEEEMTGVKNARRARGAETAVNREQRRKRKDNTTIED